MNLKIKILFFMFMVVMILIVGFVQVEILEEKGYVIFNEVEVCGDGYVDSQFDMVMILKNKQEVISECEMLVKGMEGSGDEGDKMLMVFLIFWD